MHSLTNAGNYRSIEASIPNSVPNFVLFFVTFFFSIDNA